MSFGTLSKVIATVLIEMIQRHGIMRDGLPTGREDYPSIAFLNRNSCGTLGYIVRKYLIFFGKTPNS